jgi:single-stranded-DNA-specific exonuclease RecJ
MYYLDNGGYNMQAQKRWIIKYPDYYEHENTYLDGINPIIGRLLLSRGIKDLVSYKSFVDPKISELNDPFMLPDMLKVVKLIESSVEAGKKIVIYGDYDADGITSTSILYKCLKSIGGQVGYYIPNRMDEGYGLSIDAINTIRDNGAELIITVDCGITSINEVKYCRECGIDIVITDHHECKDEIPDTLVVSAKRNDSAYPFKDLSGAGVAFKLVQALSTVYKSIDIMEYIDLAAIGTIADVVELMYENRVIAKHGLKRICSTNNAGIKALLKESGVDSEKVSSTQISFMIAPRINAIGRIADASKGVQLFTCQDLNTAESLAAELNEENKKRQQIEEKIFQEADEKIKSKYSNGKDYVYVLSSRNWHIGVIGIVASKLVEKYYRPVILFVSGEDIYRGSARSIPGFNIFKALSGCSELLQKFGGHELAAGLSLKPEDIEEFEEKINDIARSILTPDSLLPSANAEFKLSAKDITPELIEELKTLEPYGMGNPVPQFLYGPVKIDEIRAVGAQDKHLKLRLMDAGRTIDAIAFNLGYNIDEYYRNNMVDVICSPDKNVWNGRESIQLLVKEIKHSPFEAIADDYYRSLKNTIENIAGKDMDRPFSQEDLYYTGSLTDIIESAENNNTLILVSNIDMLDEILHYNLNIPVIFESNDKKDRSSYIIVNPDFGRLSFEGISYVYLMDNIVNYNYSLSFSKSPSNVNVLNAKTDFEFDIAFINSLKPSKQSIEEIFYFIKSKSVNGYYKGNIKNIAECLYTNTLRVYYGVKLLMENGAVSMSVVSMTEIIFKAGTLINLDISKSRIYIKLESIITKLNRLKHFHQN